MQTPDPSIPVSSEVAVAAPTYSQLQQRNAMLEEEVESLTVQVTNDFEELALMQALAGSLELQERATEPLALAAQFLPRVAIPAMAEAVALVTVANAFEASDPQGAQPRVLWSGEPMLSDEACQSLVQGVIGKAARVPCIVNNTTDLELDDWVREFVIVEIIHGNRLTGWMVAFNKIPPAGPRPAWAQLGFSSVEASLLMTSASILATQFHNTQLLRQKEKLFTDVVRALVNAVEARDEYTCGHSERVALYGKRLAQQAGLNPSQCDRVYLTGLLHDVGKIAIPDAVLQKPGGLDDSERTIIETHTDAGWRILNPLSQLHDVLPGVLHHHEKFDGTGYPDGLAGEAIPLDGRILAVADAYDAMTSDRPYRRGMSQERAEEILRGGAGTQWDPMLLECFFEASSDMIQIRQTYQPRAQNSRELD